MIQTKGQWGSSKLDEIATIERESISPTNIKNGTQYVGLEHMTSEGMLVDVKTVSVGELASNKFLFGPQHILYGKLRPYLKKTTLPNFEGVCSTDILPIRPSKEMDKRFLYYFLRQQHVVDLATQRCTGANLPRLSPKLLAKFVVPVPPIKEQRRIADILEKADLIRRKRGSLVSNFQELNSSLFHERFGDASTNVKQWNVVKFRELFSASPNYGTMIKPSDDTGDWLDLRVANIQNGKIDLTSKKYVELPLNMIKRHEVKDGDLLLARAIGSLHHLGKCIVAQPGGELWAFDSHLMRIRFDSSKVLPLYVHAFLVSPGGRHEFLKNSRRSAVQFNINTKEIGKIKIPLPPIQEQVKFIAELQDVKRMAKRHEVAALESENLFNSLVQLAFKGEL
ncbi:restriction endonuclease subunit S [Mariniblastus sp.]|nr:restriction endonuclease subunit S [Mariniblastus sp.]